MSPSESLWPHLYHQYNLAPSPFSDYETITTYTHKRDLERNVPSPSAPGFQTTIQTCPTQKTKLPIAQTSRGTQACLSEDLLTG